MASGGGGEDVNMPQQAQESSMGRGRRHQTTSLPLKVIADIAARSDPYTLVRCAATCSDLRGCVADPGFRLRLRHAGRFVPSLLRGHLIGDRCYSFKSEAKNKEERVYLVDATAAGATVEVRSAAESFPPGPDGEPLALQGALSARDGLVLVRRAHELRVFNLATGRSQTVPPSPGSEFTDCCHHVLLVGDGEGGAVGRPFRVVVARLALEHNHRRRLQVQTFSSELGTWGPCTDIRTPQIQGRIRRQDAHNNLYVPGGEGPRADNALGREPLVAGGAVHWLCLTDSAGYILKLRVCRTAAPRLTASKLPERFPHNDGGHVKHLLVTMEAGGSPAVLVAGGEKVSAWTHQPKHTASWNRQPQVVIEYETISRLLDSVSDVRMREREREREHVKLEWFAERSGIVLMLARGYHFLWLDLQSKKILRWSADPRIRHKTMYHPCEMDLSTWAPTFSSTSL